MKTIFLKFAAIFLFALCCNIVHAQKTVQGLDDFLKSVQAGSKLPGFAVAIVKNDAVIFSGGYGFADKAKKIPYTIQTIQPIGSVSKTFIGVALMQAIDKGYFTLETPINDVLPFKVINPWFPNAVIKIRDLATHTSGLVDNNTQYEKAYAVGKKPTIELKDFLQGYYTEGGAYYDKANFGNSEPGKKYAYSNVAAALAAYIIEIKAKTSFDKFTAAGIFGPLKMADTHWFYDEAKSSKYATLYQVDRHNDAIYKTLLNNDGSLKTYSLATYPDGALRTSVADLTKYLIEMIKGSSGQSTLLTKKSFETLFQKQFAADKMPATMDPREPNKAIFWGYNRKGKVAHTGSDPGLAAFISFDPVTKVGRVLLLNTDLEGLDNVTTIEAFVNLTKGLDTFEMGK
ncbi:MAG: serine hydrolase domain-containing protein [Ferruginibacter sp.]